jgi:hypothetical protein
MYDAGIIGAQTAVAFARKSASSSPTGVRVTEDRTDRMAKGY